MLAVWLGLWAREERRSGTGFDLCQIARNGAFNVFFRKRCILALWIHIAFLPAQSKAQPVAVVNLVALMMNPHPVLIATLFSRLKAASEAGKPFSMILGSGTRNLHPAGTADQLLPG